MTLGMDTLLESNLILYLAPLLRNFTSLKLWDLGIYEFIFFEHRDKNINLELIILVTLSSHCCSHWDQNCILTVDNNVTGEKERLTRFSGIAHVLTAMAD